MLALERFAKILTVAAAAAVAVPASPAGAQGKRDLIGSYRDWDAFTIARENGETICYMVSVPQSWKASREGVRRGDIYVTVTHRPAAQVTDEVNIVVGYPFREGSEASAVIDGQHSFDLFTEGDGAWLYNAKQDMAMVEAMKQGLTMIVRGTSSRGTDTTDRYSLSGFTAAHQAMSRACDVGA